MLLLACSNESELPIVTDSNAVNLEHAAGNPKSGATLDQLYSNMINSNNYKIYDAAHKAFVSKMNFQGNTALINSDANMLSWIDSHLSLTTFTSYTAAKNEWNAVKANHYVTFMENQGFYQGLTLAPPGTVFNYFSGPSASLAISTTSSPCTDACNNTFATQSAGYSQQYSAAVTAAFNSIQANPNGGAAVGASIGIARVIFDTSIDITADQLVICIFSCL